MFNKLKLINKNRIYAFQSGGTSRLLTIQDIPIPTMGGQAYQPTYTEVPQSYIQPQIQTQSPSQSQPQQPQSQNVNISNLQKAIQNNLNIPYVWGGKSKKGADCTGFVDLVYKELGYGNLMSGVKANLDKLQSVDKSQMQPGDIIRLKGTNPKWSKDRYSHAAIFLGYEPNGKIRVAEAAGGKSQYRTWDISKGYYANHWMDVRRMNKSKISSNKTGGKLIPKHQTGGSARLLTLNDIPIPTMQTQQQYPQTQQVIQQPTLQYNSNAPTTNLKLQTPTLSAPFNGKIPAAIQKVINKANEGKFYSPGAGKYMSLGQDAYKHKCTSGPATFYKDSLGIKLNGLWWDTGSPKTAKKTNITKAGFSEKWSGDGNDVRNGNWKQVVRPGDIMVIFSSNSGHAQMWDGTKWISDTNQSKAWCYGKDNGRAGKRSAILYRNDSLWT